MTFYDWPTFYEADFANKITVCSYSNETADVAPVIYFQHHVVADQHLYELAYYTFTGGREFMISQNLAVAERDTQSEHICETIL